MKKALPLSVMAIGRALLDAHKRAETEKPLPPLTVYVIAGNHHQYQTFCRAQGLSASYASYVINAEWLRGARGMTPDRFHFVGTWDERPDAELLRCAVEDACRS